MEVFIVMLRIGVGLTIAAALLVPVLCVLARRHWRSSRPALWPHRVALGSVVWGALWVVLNIQVLPVWIALQPLALCGLGFTYVAVGNRRRGHRSPGLVVAGLSAAALAVAALFATRFGMGLYHDAVAAEQAARAAEGQRSQDRFDSVVRLDDATIAVIGTTSSEPSDSDDVWVHVLDADGELLEAVTYQRPGDQAGFALAVEQDGSWVLGGTDDDHPFVARATPAGITHYHRWDAPGSLRVLHAFGGGRFLAGGYLGDAAWIGVIDGSGREQWSADLDTGIADAEVTSLAVVGDWFVAVGSDHIMSRGAFAAGGTLAGRIEWTMAFPGATTALTHVRADPDGDFVALGHRGRAGALEDLWLVRLSGDGAILKEITIGGASGEYSGGLALRGDDVIVVGHRFTVPDSTLWIQALDPTGIVKWQSAHPNSRSGRAADVAVLPGGDILVVGDRTPESKSDAWVARFDPNGNLLWQRTYPAPGR